MTMHFYVVLIVIHRGP